ncbi:MAG: peptidylprolyl isomerase [Bacteroidota bacterium]
MKKEKRLFMANYFKWSIITLVFFVLEGCDLIQMKQENDQPGLNKKAVARVGEQFLYAEDLDGLVYEGILAEDSTERTRAFINNWIRKQLLIKEASTKIEFDEAEIERKMLDYKFSLMGYEYQLHYISQNLNKQVSDEEIQTYYEENIDNFVLKQNIIRSKFIQVPKEAPKLNRLRVLLYSSREKDIEELNSYCLSFATAYELNDSIWMAFDEVVQNSPLAEIPNKLQFLRNRKYSETEDDEFKYYLKIEEYRISDNVSPLEFVREDIINIVINKRKVELAQGLEAKIYEEAKKNNGFEIYN